jgi:hypothetical protein
MKSELILRLVNILFMLFENHEFCKGKFLYLGFDFNTVNKNSVIF